MSFGEIVVIGGVALIVIGPERLPGVARTVGALVARAQRYVAGVKAEVQREIELDNLRKIESEMNEQGRKLGQDISGNFDAFASSISSAASVSDVHSQPESVPNDPPLRVTPPRDRR